jgi:hypothetical protein
MKYKLKCSCGITYDSREDSIEGVKCPMCNDVYEILEENE